MRTISILALMIFIVSLSCTRSVHVNKSEKMLDVKYISTCKLYGFDEFLITTSLKGVSIFKVVSRVNVKKILDIDLNKVKEVIKDGDVLVFHSLEKIIGYSLEKEAVIWEHNIGVNLTDKVKVLEGELRFFVVCKGEHQLIDIRTLDGRIKLVKQKDIIDETKIYSDAYLTGNGVLLKSDVNSSLEYYANYDLNTLVWENEYLRSDFRRIKILVNNKSLFCVFGENVEVIDLENGKVKKTFDVPFNIDNIVFGDKLIVISTKEKAFVLSYDLTFKKEFETNGEGVFHIRDDVFYSIESSKSIKIQREGESIKYNIGENGLLSNIIDFNNTYVFVSKLGEFVFVDIKTSS